MNATEAREIAVKNADKVANRQLEEAVARMDQEIRENVDLGFFDARIEIKPSEQWMKYNCTNRFRKHFREKGFGVEFDEFGTNLILICTWY